ncbi:PAS factor family protein [Vibrio natriegens]|uniref:PAS factor family protein n=1 Tax=Vibrio TaxID=662 RepID=UPI000E4865CB|nr:MULTISPECIES: PAS factor family protein [Vibrio]AXT72978.1 secretion protein [Vibrio sp. dhg]UYI50054.1 PAS factor family protein [Vibrio natriegens]
MEQTRDIIYSTLQNLIENAPEQHARIRQTLYEQLKLPFEKQLALYNNILGPVSAGRLGSDNLRQTVDLALEVLKAPQSSL